MSITAAELIAYGAANKPTDDVSTGGGAIDATYRPVFTQLTATKKLSFKSDGADTRTVTITGRDATGALVTETITLNGTTEVDTVNTYERILIIAAGATSGTRTISFYQDIGLSTLMGTIPINETGVYAQFENAVSSASPTTRYDKFFFKNTDSTLTLTSSTVTLTVDPSTLMQQGIHTAVNDTATITNRLTAPAGVSFVGTSTAQSVPGGGNLAAGAAIGVWTKQTLGANQAAQKNAFTEQLAGSST